jgi:adenosylhomocysteine nucleosidase
MLRLMSMSRNLRRLAGIAVLCALAATAASAQSAPLARLGILMPVGPPDYRVVFDAMHVTKRERFGPFTFVVGTIHGVPSVVTIPPGDGPLIRSFAAQEMVNHYHIKAIFYPGTSGAHLDVDQMRIGDVVLGAENVDFGNFFISKTGVIDPSQFTQKKRYAGLYADPRLLGALACSARRVAARTSIPAWLDAHQRLRKPAIFYFGIQGTSQMWLANRELMMKLQQTFHEVDEDGDWYSALLATIYHIPFIEVSTISDSIFQFPQTARGIPKAPPGAVGNASLVAQRISNEIMVDMIARDGVRILNGSYTTPLTDPFPPGVFERPKDAGSLLAGCPA